MLEAFKQLKLDLRDSSLQTIDYDREFVVETDASDFCIAATLNQLGRPVAFFSRTLHGSEIGHHAVEKEAAAIVEFIREWRHFLVGRKFKLITDQKSISFMFDNKRKSKIKSTKIARWRVELAHSTNSTFNIDLGRRTKRLIRSQELRRLDILCQSYRNCTSSSVIQA